MVALTYDDNFGFGNEIYQTAYNIYYKFRNDDPLTHLYLAQEELIDYPEELKKYIDLFIISVDEKLKAISI